MSDFAKKLEDIGREEGGIFDVERAGPSEDVGADFDETPAMRRIKEGAYKERNKRRRELRWHYRITKVMGYVERILNRVGIYRT